MKVIISTKESMSKQTDSSDRQALTVADDAVEVADLLHTAIGVQECNELCCSKKKAGDQDCCCCKRWSAGGKRTHSMQTS